MDNNSLSQILGVYYNAIRIPVIFLNEANDIVIRYPNDLECQTLITFLGFKEILDFIDDIFRQELYRSPHYCIFHTHNFFTYIVIVSQYGRLSGTIISGPISTYPLDEKRADELLLQGDIQLNKKNESKLFLTSLPHMPTDQISHISKLLYALVNNELNFDTIPEPTVCSNWAQMKPMMGNTTGTNISYITYRKNYKFFRNMRDRIIHGSIEGMNKLINTSLDVLWDIGDKNDVYNSLKIKYVFICTYSCICSIQAGVPHDQIINILIQAEENMSFWKTPDDIISCMISVIKACTATVSANENRYSFHVNHALQYMRQHYAEKISLEALAGYMMLNPVYLSSLIKKETKLSLYGNINKIRIEQSCNLLTYTDKSINEIAFAVGFNYQSHFCNVFKKITDMTPQEFRNKYNKLPL